MHFWKGSTAHWGPLCGGGGLKSLGPGPSHGPLRGGPDGGMLIPGPGGWGRPPGGIMGGW